MLTYDAVAGTLGLMGSAPIRVAPDAEKAQASGSLRYSVRASSQQSPGPVAPVRVILGNQAMLRQRTVSQRARKNSDEDRHGTDVSGAVPDTVRATVHSPGRALDQPERAAMESHFGADLSQVRIHDDAAAAASASDVGARAYTVGPHIAFGHGEYRPTDPAGRALLAHELTHAVQQGNAAIGGGIAIGAVNTAAEREADAASRLVASGHPSQVSLTKGATRSAGRGVLQRQPAMPALGKGTYPGSPTLEGEELPDRGVSTELSDSPEAGSSAERVFKWLQAHAAEIGWLESLFGVDRRAIAGAIAWEALRNPRWFFPTGIFGRFVGAGKPHVREFMKAPPAVIYSGETVPAEVEEAGLLPRRSVLEREITLARDSIPYVAASMRLAVDIARAYGVDISRDPAILTWFWVSSNTNKFIAHLSGKQDRTFDPTQEEMPRWVVENLRWLEVAVGESQLRPVDSQPTGGVEPAPRLGTLETASWSGSYQLSGRLPETREFLVNTGAIVLTISADTEFFRANGYPIYVVLHRRQGGADPAIGEAKPFSIGSEVTFSWSGLTDGLYFFEIFSNNGVPVEGEMTVTLGKRPPLGEAVSPAQAPAILQRAPLEADAGTVADAGMPDAGVASPPVKPAMPTVVTDEGLLRANAARELVAKLVLKKAVYGHEKDSAGFRKAGWWWEETEFDCSKFVLWVLAGRKVGDPQLLSGELPEKAIRQVTVAPFGLVADASAVKAMISIVEALVGEGKAGPIEKDRPPRVGDLVFWGGHVAIVVDVRPVGDTGDSWVVYANMGLSGAGLVGIDAKGNRWLKASQVAERKELADGVFKGYWTP